MIVVKNLRDRLVLGDGWKVVRCDRQTPIGNPFYMRSESERDDVCEKFETALYEGTLSDEAYTYLHEIIVKAKKGNVCLTCWCAPKRCHCDSIKKYVEEWTEAGL